MKFNKVREVLKLLLIKKNNFIINTDEQSLIDEIEALLTLANSSEIRVANKECNCKFDESTIEKEIERNQCLHCGLPLSTL